MRKSDVIILGSARKCLLITRFFLKKIYFYYSERPLKNGDNSIMHLPRWIKWHLQMKNSKKSYLLCSSAYSASDYSKYGFYKNRSLKWGYFPKTLHYDLNLLFENKDIHRILWCGRLINLKHPDDVIRVAQRLKSDGYIFCLDIIGTGTMEETLRQMIRDFNLENYVRLLGAMSSEKVRENMENSGIYLFTSDKREGWGAVLNESMNSGCAVIASHAIGSVPFLLEDNNNGLIYKSGNIDVLYHKVKFLLDHPEEQRRLGEAAYKTIIDEWNAETAAERFINLAQHIIDGEKNLNLYASGPCSEAEIIEDDWYHGE